MKARFYVWLLAFVTGFVLLLPVAKADVDISVGVQVNAVGDFDAPLTHHGAWVEVGSYGRCWRPARVAVEWRPYCDGHWEWTDCGWYWVSDEPWAWACYHYGSWHHDAFHGWVWVPGVEWAPAWVYWRVGGGHIGWAPCAPRGVVVASSTFVFVGTTHFRERVRPTTVIVNNTTIINKTTQITEIRRESRNIGGRTERVVINNGPGVDVVQKATRKQFAAVPVQEVDRKTAVPTEVKRRPFGQKPDNSPAVREQGQTKPEAKAEPQKGEQPRVPQQKPELPNAEQKSPRKADPAEGKVVPQPEKPSGPPDKVAPAPERKPEQPVRPGRGRSSRDDLRPNPQRPPTQSPSPNRDSGPSQGKQGKGSDRGKQRPD